MCPTRQGTRRARFICLSGGCARTFSSSYDPCDYRPWMPPWRQARWVERGAVVLVERSLVPRASFGEKRPARDDEGQTSRERPPSSPRPPRFRPQGRGFSRCQRFGEPRQRQQHQRQYLQQRQDRCVICGGPHSPPQCDQRQGLCYRCRQTRHFQSACP